MIQKSNDAIKKITITYEDEANIKKKQLKNSLKNNLNKEIKDLKEK